MFADGLVSIDKVQAASDDRRRRIRSKLRGIYIISLALACAAGCRSQAAITDVVDAFGAALSQVSLLAPPDTVRREIREAYGTLVTPELLASWLERPSTAPGRSVSSPWPQRIDILNVRRAGAAYEVVGDVIYVTSVEVAEGGAAERQRVSLRLVRDSTRAWKIAAYEPLTTDN